MSAIRLKFLEYNFRGYFRSQPVREKDAQTWKQIQSDRLCIFLSLLSMVVVMNKCIASPIPCVLLELSIKIAFLYLYRQQTR